MKPKVLDCHTDWKIVKDTQLDFIQDDSKAVYADYKYTATISDKAKNTAESSDPKDAFLKALVMIGAYN